MFRPNFHFLIFGLIFIEMMCGSFSYAQSHKIGTCLSIHLSLLLSEIDSRLSNDELELIRSRLKQKSARASLKSSLTDIKSVLTKSENEFSIEELQDLSILSNTLKEMPYGLPDLAAKVDKKIFRIRKFFAGEVKGVHFSSSAEKDLNSLDNVAKKNLMSKVLPKIMEAPRAGEVKVGIPNKYKFKDYRAPGGYFIAAYEVQINGEITVLMVGPHENFYSLFRRRMGLSK